jgi:hypothetical protein
LVAATESESFFEDFFDGDLLVEVDAAARLERVCFVAVLELFAGDAFARVALLEVEFLLTAFFISISSGKRVGPGEGRK